MRGYELAISEAGREPIVGEGGFRLERSQEATADLIANHAELDGLVVANNLMAIGALAALRKAGVKIPDDVAVVGIDDPPWAALVSPAMTTFAQPTQIMATMAFGVIGSLASQDMARLAAYSVLVSSGTVLAAIGIGQVGVTGGALFYLISSTLGLGAFFLLTELVERGREPGADVLAVTRELYGEDDEDEVDESDEIGIAIPATMGILGLAFVGCALVISGLPPLSGFIAKFALLTAALNPPNGAISIASWVLLPLLILSGLAAMIAMIRAGIRAFWASPDRAVPRVRLIEVGPVAVLLLLCAIQTIQAGPIMRFMQATAQSLHEPHGYIRGVLGSTAERSSDPAEVK